jgi:uncharacterized protein
MERSDSPPVPLMHGLRRWPWLVLAWLCLGLAVLGVILPGLPTTPFVLVAAWAASRGSRRLHDWLHAHRLFGTIIRDWEAEGAVSRRAKLTAIATMLLCAVILIVFTPHWAFAATGCTFMLLVGSWLWLRPEPQAAPR